MADITTTTAANFIPEVWSDEVKAAYEEALVISNRVKKFDHMKQHGDTIHVPDVSNMDANDMSESGEVNAQAITEGETQILLDKWKESSFRLRDLANVQSKYDLRSKYSGKAGFAIAKKIEQDVMALGLSAGNAYDADGTAASASGGTINVAGILKGVQALDDNDVPSNNRYLIVNPAARNDMLKINQFTSIDYVNQKPTVSAKIGEIFGMEVFVSNLLPTDTNSKTNALIYQQDAFALAVQQSPRTQADYEQRFLAWLVTVDVVYGVKIFRANNAVRLVLA